jgi:hypothetical protein
MNYSASEDYHDKCRQFDKKSISRAKIKKRWFRNSYVLYQSKGYFTHNTFVLNYGEFDPNQYSGEYYGPFNRKDAIVFANQLKRTHENFILG